MGARTLLWLCVGFALLALSATAQAAIQSRAVRARVLLIHEPLPDLLINELVTRIRGELTAAGFTVDVSARQSVGDPRAAVEGATDEAIVAAFAIMRDNEAGAVEVWLHDQLTHKTTVRSVSIGAGDSKQHNTQVLAVRVVELLRASLLELIANTAQRSEQESKPVPPRVTEWVETAAPKSHEPRRRHNAALGVGVGLLQSFDRVSSSLLPRVHVDVALASALAARLSVAGVGTTPQVDAPAGSARLQQAVAVLELVWCVRLGSRGCLEGFAGGGVFHTRAVGEAASPYLAQQRDRWSGAVSGGLGISWLLPWRLSLTARTQALVLWPQPFIRIAGVDAGRVGRPSLLTGVDLAFAF